MAAFNHSVDPTLAAMDALHERASGDPPRPHLGASQIGHPCARALWYGFRWAIARKISAKGHRAIADGHRGEAVMAGWLRQIPGVELWLEDPEQPGRQIGFLDHAGHFGGSVDGVIVGLLQAPKAPHVWECKVVNETKFRKLVKLIVEKGEKSALAEWDEVYFAQAQIYLKYLGLTRHYLTACTPGNRDFVGCRTEFQPKAADRYVERAKTVIVACRPPEKISEDPGWFQCRFCDFQTICHGQKLPETNCRTCAHSTAHLDEARPWTCDLHRRAISADEQRRGCPHYAFHPDLVASCDAVAADQATGAITYRCKETGDTFASGFRPEGSHEIA